MQAGVQDQPLLVSAIVDYAARWHPRQRIHSLDVEGGCSTSTYAELRTAALACAALLQSLHVRCVQREEPCMRVWLCCRPCGQPLLCQQQQQQQHGVQHSPWWIFSTCSCVLCARLRWAGMHQQRARSLLAASGTGVCRQGDVVATLCCNTRRHLVRPGTAPCLLSLDWRGCMACLPCLQTGPPCAGRSRQGGQPVRRRPGTAAWAWARSATR